MKINTKKKQSLPTKTKIKSSKKEMSGFTLMLIPNSSDNTKTIEITFDHLVRAFSAAVAIVIIMVGLIISMVVQNHDLKYGNDNTRKTISDLREENRALSEEVSNLSVSLASSEAVLSKIEGQLTRDSLAAEKEKEEECIPTEVPLKGGTAIVVKDPTIDSESGEEEDGIVFTVLKGSVVVASASGSVISVDSDPNYTNKVVIDHGNGYMTTYRTNALLKVSFGDTVRKNDMIAIVTEEEGTVAYEITYNGLLVDPYEMIQN